MTRFLMKNKDKYKPEKISEKTLRSSFFEQVACQDIEVQKKRFAQIPD